METYLAVVKQVAKESEVYFRDMKAKPKKLVEEMGHEKSKQLFLYIKSGIYLLRSKGLSDNTHLSQQGVFTIAGLVVQGMKELNIPVARYLVKK